jgi:membrane protease YdiL (CAAX protease family)
MSEKAKSQPERPESSESSIKQLFFGRALLFVEIMIILLFNFVIYYLINFFYRIDMHSTDPIDLITLYYAEPLISIVIGSIIGLLLIKSIFKGRELHPHEDLTPLNDVYSTLRVSKSNVKYQIMYTFLLLFLIYIPLDFLAYSIPGVMDFSIRSLSGSSSEFLFNQPLYVIFVGFAVIMYSCVGCREELLFRAISLSRGRRYIGNYSSIFLFSIAFGASHFAYLALSDNFLEDLIPALIWGLSALIIGLAMGTFFIKKRYLIPLILAHTLNNIISATALWLFHEKSIAFLDIAKTLYLPLLIVSVLLFVIFFGQVKSGLKSFGKIPHEYFTESGDSKIFMILLDLALGFIMFFITLFLF